MSLPSLWASGRCRSRHSRPPRNHRPCGQIARPLAPDGSRLSNNVHVSLSLALWQLVDGMADEHGRLQLSVFVSRDPRVNAKSSNPLRRGDALDLSRRNETMPRQVLLRATACYSLQMPMLDSAQGLHIDVGLPRTDAAKRQLEQLLGRSGWYLCFNPTLLLQIFAPSLANPAANNACTIIYCPGRPAQSERSLSH